MSQSQQGGPKPVMAYRFKGNGIKGKESITEFTPLTWKNFNAVKKNGERVFKDSANWKLVDENMEINVEADEVKLSKDDVRKATNATPELTPIQREFNALIGQAESLMIQDKKSEAVDVYKKASELMPEERYPKEQIKKLNIELATPKVEKEEIGAKAETGSDDQDVK